MRKEKLQETIKTVELMKKLVNEDLLVTIWSKEGEVLYFSGDKENKIKLDVGFKNPDKNDKIFEVMRSGIAIDNFLPKEVFGNAVKGRIGPITDGGEVVGCVTSALLLKLIMERKENKATKILEDSKTPIYEILNSSINTTENLKEVDQYVNDLEKSVGGVYRVVDSIKGNTSRTKMLALNASIEAARAGESGKGFKIVANEMGKLSQMSAESVVSINNTLEEMKKSIEDVVSTINEINNSSFKNSEVTQRILSELSEVLD